MSDVMVIDSSTLKSMEVAEMVEKEHSKLLRDIRRYIKQLGEAKIGFSDFFQESTYVSEQNKIMPCFDITRKGCEFIAHKMTGPKGTVFTARYINRFHEMENHLKVERVPLLEYKDVPKVPLNPDWYDRNRGRIERVCGKYKAPRKTLYRFLLKHIGEWYDLDEAREIYYKEVGHYPEYSIDIVSYFPELGKMADELLTKVDK